MPTFTKMRPAEVTLGRGRIAAARQQPFIDAIQDGQAGSIELAMNDKASRVKGDLRRASKRCGIRVRSSWADSTELVLLWKRVGARAGSEAAR